MPVLYDQVTQCLGSLTFSLVSATSTNDVPTIRRTHKILDRTRSHASSSWHEQIVALALISSQNRLKVWSQNDFITATFKSTWPTMLLKKISSILKFIESFQPLTNVTKSSPSRLSTVPSRFHTSCVFIGDVETTWFTLHGIVMVSIWPVIIYESWNKWSNGS